jgi:hypothetical protein
MKLNLIAILYWKRLCRIKEFDLRNQKHRLLVVIFWIIILSSITTSSVFLVKYNQEKAKYDQNEAVIDDFEAKFALNRCLENLKEEAQTLQEYYLSKKEYLTSFIEAKIHSKKFSGNEIFKTFQKVLSHVVNKDFDIEYTSQDLAIIYTIQKHHQTWLSNPEYDIPNPNNHILNNGIVFLMLEQNLEPFSNERILRIRSFYKMLFNLADASLKIDGFEYTDSLGNTEEAWPKSINFNPYFALEMNDIDLDNLSSESAKMISSYLPENYQIENYFETQHIRSDPSYNGIRYVQSYLIDPFRKLTFFNPESFNPEDLKSNLKWAKITNDNILDAGYRNLLFILSIIGANLFLVFIIRIFRWVLVG